jgi:hypothetical protein
MSSANASGQSATKIHSQFMIAARSTDRSIIPAQQKIRMTRAIFVNAEK